MMTKFTAHAITAEEVLRYYKSCLQGLGSADIKKRQDEYGLNKLPEAKPVPAWHIFLSQFKDPLIYILLAAGGVTFFMGHYPSAAFIFIVLIINALIGGIQEYSATREAAALRKLVSPAATVIRDGVQKDIQSTDLVPGDIVMVQSGNKVPADIRLIKSTNLRANESLLTGESQAAEKKAEHLAEPNAPINELCNMIFAGTIIAYGRGTGIVTATGPQTRIGGIASEIMREERVDSPLVIRIRKFTIQLSLVIAIVIAFISASLFLRGDPWQDIFLTAIGLAVAAIPEGLPVTVTIALALGMRRMARRHVIVRRLNAVESLGSCTVIATDKTGTLTQNRLSIEKIALPGASSAASPSDIQNKSALEKLYIAGLLANEAVLKKDNNGWSGEGDAVDIALMIAAQQEHMSRDNLLQQYPEIYRLPYESEQKFAASFHEYDGQVQVFVKGAVDTLLDMCTAQENPDGTGSQALRKEAIKAQEESLSAQQFRVLAFASGPVRRQNEYSAADIHHLNFIGIIGLRDPLRTDAADSIAACRQAGIDVVMITGDHPDTAYAIGRELGLCDNKKNVVTGKELALAASQDDPADFNLLTTQSKIYARIEPSQKLSILEAIQKRGEYVAMTGDGVNDAPALKHAHVGVAMGKSGTDVARESADIILTDDKFSSIVAGIQEGRCAYNNIRKIVFFLICASFGEVLLFLAAIAFSMPAPLLAAQLLWINFVTSVIQDVALAFEKPEGHELKRPPRAPDEPIFNRLMIGRTCLVSSLMALITFTEFQWLLQRGADIDYIRNILVLQFVLCSNVLVLNSRSEDRSFFAQPLTTNPFLFYGVIAAQAVHISAMYIPGLRDVLKIEPVSPQVWAVLLSFAFIIMAVLEIEKAWRRGWRQKSARS